MFKPLSTLSSLLPPKKKTLTSGRMCRHEFYRSNACGHHFPKLPPPAEENRFFADHFPTIAVPKSLTCSPVKLALKFYHDQVVYEPADMTCPTNVEIPKSCPIVHGSRDGMSRRAQRETQKAQRWLQNRMKENGLGRPQLEQCQIDAMIPDQCSNRAKPGKHNPADLRKHKRQPYPLNMHAHVESVKRFQARDKRDMTPNVEYIEVAFGCGGPFSAECLTGWTGIGLLTHRLHLWGDSVTHPKPCSDECLAGWSGRDLDSYREQTWAGHNPKMWKDRYPSYPNSKTWKNDVYPWLTLHHVSRHAENWAAIDYSNISHLHTDQFYWNGHQLVRVKQRMDPQSNTPQSVHIPDEVWVPVPERLSQVLRKMDPVLARPHSSPRPKDNDDDQASIEYILERLPQAFEEQGPWTGGSSQAPPTVNSSNVSTTQEEEVLTSPSVLVIRGGCCDSDTTVADESEEGGSAQEKDLTLVRVETPEEAEARRQRAIKRIREKIARDFPTGSQEKTVIVVVEEGKLPPVSYRYTKTVRLTV